MPAWSRPRSTQRAAGVCMAPGRELTAMPVVGTGGIGGLDLGRPGKMWVGGRREGERRGVEERRESSAGWFGGCGGRLTGASGCPL